MALRAVVLSIGLGFSTAWILSAPAQEGVQPDAITVDGGRYFGPIVNGTLHGVGRIEWESGAHYEGEFDRGQLSGHGKLHDGVDQKYAGQFKNGVFEGKGRFETPDGQVYDGQFVKNKFSGQGIYTRPDGTRYEGEFLNWRFHGQGYFKDPAGVTYRGKFVAGEFSDRGESATPDGAHYTGEFKNWRPHGSGVLKLPNGDTYRGSFAFGVFDGEGTMWYAQARPDGRLRDRGIWRQGELQDPKREHQRRVNVETALYKQTSLLNNAIAKLSPSSAEKINMYLLAIGGDGSQEVFRREVEFVTQQFSREFGAQSIALINSPTTVASQPMATITSIEASIQAIADRMDRERDILFLFITSHGSQTHEISLNQAAMRLRDLPARELGRIVKDSGIRWKVILLSTCYSGGFIDALKDDHTLIITAARHDRQSFGCADDNDFTYFGRAYFKEALPHSASFQDAFQRAQTLITKWEQKDFAGKDLQGEKDEHSLPQMVSPKLVEEHLARWWAQRLTTRSARLNP